MKSHLNIIFAFSLLITFSLFSCKKDWLDAKSDITLAIPNTLDDCQALLDNTIMTTANVGFGEVSSNDFTISKVNWDAMSFLERNSYIWEKQLFESEDVQFADWNRSYNKVYYANLTLESLDKISETSDNAQRINELKGAALFFRGFTFFELAQVFAKPYDQNTALLDLGIPLRLTSNFNEKTKRSNLSETYELIISDIKNSIELLPTNQANLLRPTKAAAYGLMARVYLAMRKYSDAFEYANLCINNASAQLLDFNDVSATPNYTMARFNSEVIFWSRITSIIILSDSYHNIDEQLYASYQTNDLRRSLYFRLNSGRTVFRGSYSAGNLGFAGIALDEMYLIRAEGHARSNRISEALLDLNTLLKKRWNKNVTYVNITAVNADDALSKILVERRKELLFRGLTWIDLRRLNFDDRFKRTLTRNLDGTLYTLLPNDPRYTLPIPQNVIKLTGIEQNIR